VPGQAVSTPALIACITALEAVIFTSIGAATAQYMHARAEQARRDEQQTNEKETQ
jgi:hypothetical protein